MKCEPTMDGLKIIAESDLEGAYLRDTIGLEVGDDGASLVVRHVMPTGYKGLTQALADILKSGPKTNAELAGLVGVHGT